MLKLWRRIAGVIQHRRAEAELETELEFHRAERQAALERGGMPPDVARAESRRAMGNVTLAREEARRVWLGAWCESVGQDAVYGLRLLRTAPAFAAASRGRCSSIFSHTIPPPSPRRPRFSLP